MDELNINEVSIPVNEDNDAILPDGWADGDDIFDDAAWTGGTPETADEPGEGGAGAQSEQVGQDDDADDENDALTNELEAAAAGETDEADPAPTKELTPAESKRLKFKARVDHEDLDVELDEAELPSLYQKAKVVDRTQARLNEMTSKLTKLEGAEPKLTKLQRLAKAMGYDSDDAMLEGALENLRTSKIEELVAKGTPEEIARDYVDRIVGSDTAQVSEKPATDPAPTPEHDQTNTRDFKAEVTELLDAKPSLRGQKLPDEVVQAAVKDGKNLLIAYTEWAESKSKAELEALRKENKILKQNAASAARAPVKGVSKGGPTDTRPDDPFLKGFDSDDW